MAFNTTPIYRTPAGWVKQLNSGEILGPVATKIQAEALVKEEAKVAKAAKAAKTDDSAAPSGK